jgi:hypothetical protein
MSVLRKTSKDYKKELADIKQQQKALEARIRNRCKEMITKNPNVHMGTIDYANAPAGNVFTRDYLQNIDRHGMETIFDLMEMIEADLASKQQHKQTAIEF